MKIIEKLKERAEYYKSTLDSMKRYGGNTEMARGMTRMVLQMPSDTLRKLRWKAIGLGSNVEQITLKFPKFKLAVDAHDDGIAAELALDHVHEPIGTEVLLSILKDEMTMVDLGANIGYYTVQAACHHNLKRLISLEPIPQCFELLGENVHMNNCRQVELFNVGISDIDGMMPFYISKYSNSGSITPREEYRRKHDIQVVKLDTLMERENVEHVDLIRMDVEGHEIHAIRGMLDTIRRDRPWICMEYHTPQISEEEREYFITTLESLGYELKCFMFRHSDTPIFGRTILDSQNVLKQGELRNVLETITTQVMLLFIAPRETAFEMPSL